MSRVKTFVATGVAPDGRLYAGDLNSIQDHYADLSNLSQTVDVGTLRVGETALSLIRYGAGEARITGALRTDGITRALGGLYAGQFTTAQRDAITTGNAPTGITVYNTDNTRFEWNSGTDGARVWRPIAFNAAGALVFPDATVQSTAASNAVAPVGLLSARPAAGAGNNNRFYYATDQAVLYVGASNVWVRVGHAAGDIIWTLEATARPGYVLCQGQSWPGTTGIYADLFAIWGGATLPDFRGRGFWAQGTSTETASLAQSDGVAVGSRSPKHNTSKAESAHLHTVDGHTHTVNSHAHGGGNHYHPITDVTHTHGIMVTIDTKGPDTLNVAYIYPFDRSATWITDPSYSGINHTEYSGNTIGAEAPGTSVSAPGTNAITTGLTVGPNGSLVNDSPSYVVLQPQAKL